MLPGLPSPQPHPLLPGIPGFVGTGFALQPWCLLRQSSLAQIMRLVGSLLDQLLTSAALWGPCTSLLGILVLAGELEVNQLLLPGFKSPEVTQV